MQYANYFYLGILGALPFKWILSDIQIFNTLVLSSFGISEKILPKFSSPRLRGMNQEFSPADQ